jgi:glycosyltransferase involved in cell wall biosynthesis
MIARNEAENLGRCLRSVEGLVDEIVVVDTGSTDDTVEIALSFGAKVIASQWRDDFSLARNISLENASGDWIFFLDCDEELAPGCGQELRKVVENPNFEAYFVRVVNLTEAGTELCVPSLRLFRNRRFYRFVGRIHEQIIGSIVAHNGQQSIGETRITIIHHGYDSRSVNIRAKVHRNMRILNSYQDDQKNGFYFYNLGTEHLRLGEKEKALSCFLKAAELTHPMRSYGPMLVKKMITTLMELRNYKEAVQRLHYYQSIYKDFKDLVFLEAVCHLKCGFYTEASTRLQHYLELPPSPSCYPTETVNFGASLDQFLQKIRSLCIEKNYPDLSVCIIGRDEGVHIEKCIKSVNEIASEVVYVDTGSRDETPVLAYQMGASVYKVPWNSDFSEIRNYALEKASGEWVLFLDADEILPDESRKEIANLIKEGNCSGYCLKINTYLDHEIFSTNRHLKGSCRLFRRGSFQYQGSVMEKICPDPWASGEIAPADIVIDHFHYYSEQHRITHKRERKIQAIKKGLAGEPWKKSYALGVEFFYARDFVSAVDCFQHCFEMSRMPEVPDFLNFYALTLINLENYEDSRKILEEAVALFPDYTDLFYLGAVSYFMLGEFEKAESLSHKCLEMGETPWEKYLTCPGVGSFKAMSLLGMLYAKNGLLQKALEYFSKAADFPEGLVDVIDCMVSVHHKLPVSLEDFLKEKELFSPSSLALVAKSCSKRGHYEEALRFLGLACEQFGGGSSPGNICNVAQAIKLLLRNFWNHSRRFFPENSSFHALFPVRG